MGNMDPGLIHLQIDGQRIPEFQTLTDVQVGEDSSYNDGPGGVATGHNDKGRSNKLQFTFDVDQTSKGLSTPLKKALRSEKSRVHAYVREEDREIIADEELIELFTGNARINHRGGPFKQEEAGEHSFEVLGIGGDIVFKGGETITVDPKGEEQV